MPKITVIIPVFNTSSYLVDCLDSVLAQSFDDFEAICVNDGSTDKSAEILTEYAEKDKRIKVITQKNQGLSAARNTGLDAAKGKWICFVDSDDALPNYSLKVLYEIAEKSDCQIVASRNRLSTGQQKAIQKGRIKVPISLNYRTWNGLRDFTQDNKIYSSAWNKLFAKELFATVRFKEGMLFEDWPVMTILFGQVKTYATTNIPCYIYRQDNTSITRSSFSLKKLDSYMQGIHMVYNTYQGTKQLNFARKRMAIAVKMVVNKVYHAKNAMLTKALLDEINRLHTDKILTPKDLSLKTRFRLWRLNHC